MVAQALIPAIRETVKTNEIGGDTPYKTSFARKGTSGTSFGFMQGDMNKRPDAVAALRNALDAAGVNAAAAARLVQALSGPQPGGNPLSAADTKTVNDALAGAGGRPLVDTLDMTILQGVLDNLDGCIAAAAGRALEVEPMALLYMAPWINMTGAPTTLKKWLGGTPVDGLPPPPPAPMVTAEHMDGYMRAQKFFRENPKNYTHFTDSVKAGARFLPSA